MGADSGETEGCLSAGAEAPGWLALVIYVPGPLCEFLDELRRDLIHGCEPHAHVSVLPPRRVRACWETVRDQARERLSGRAPFRIGAAEVGVFPETDVVYLEIGDGGDELRGLHAELNSGALAYAEPFPFHPHITLAQEIPEGRLEETRDRAARRWREYGGERSFLAERAILVRHAGGARWEDLAGIPLGAVPVVGR
jgi:hypothetical protein